MLLRRGFQSAVEPRLDPAALAAPNPRPAPYAEAHRARHSRGPGDAEVRFTTAVSDAAMGSPAQYDDAGQLICPEVKPVWQAAAWWLERRRREDYGLRVGVSVNGRDRGEGHRG